MRHVTCDMWHVTCDTWHVTYDMLKRQPGLLLGKPTCNDNIQRYATEEMPSNYPDVSPGVSDGIPADRSDSVSQMIRPAKCLPSGTVWLPDSELPLWHQLGVMIKVQHNGCPELCWKASVWLCGRGSCIGEANQHSCVVKCVKPNTSKPLHSCECEGCESQLEVAKRQRPQRGRVWDTSVAGSKVSVPCTSEANCVAGESSLV